MNIIDVPLWMIDGIDEPLYRSGEATSFQGDEKFMSMIHTGTGERGCRCAYVVQ
jgi:hypothetical protein